MQGDLDGYWKMCITYPIDIAAYDPTLYNTKEYEEDNDDDENMI